MKLIKLLRFDLTNGLLKKPQLYLYPVLVAFIACIDMLNRVSYMNEFGHTNGFIQAGFQDYLMYIYGGMDKYIPEPGNPFIFPVRWMVVFLSISFFTLNYPYKDMQHIGQQILIRSENRSTWWLSKCIWCASSTLVYHILLFTSTVVFVILVEGRFSGAIDKDLLYVVFQVDLKSIQQTETPWPLTMLFLPVLVSLCLNLFQMTLSLYIKPIFSFFSIALILVSSAYFTSSYFVGNYAMPIRYDPVINGGVSILAGYFVISVIGVLSVICGVISFNNYDIINVD